MVVDWLDIAVEPMCLHTLGRPTETDQPTDRYRDRHIETHTAYRRASICAFRTHAGRLQAVRGKRGRAHWLGLLGEEEEGDGALWASLVLSAFPARSLGLLGEEKEEERGGVWLSLRSSSDERLSCMRAMACVC